MTRIIKFFFIAFLLLAAGVLSGLLVMNLTFRGEEVVVPDISGKDIVFALEVLSERGLNLRVKEWEYSNTIPKNYVISQKPSAGQSLKKDSEVKVVLSRGTKEVVVPSLVGQMRRKAEMVLKGNGLKIGGITSVYSASYQKNTIIAQDPFPQTKAGRGTSVNLLVSKGLKKDAYLMPNLVKKDLKEVMKILGEMRLLPGEIKEEVKDDIKPGFVLAHEPGYGSKVIEGEKVNFVVSSSPGPDKSQEGTYQLLYYKVPQEMGLVRVRIVLENNSGVKEIYNAKIKGGQDIKQLIKVDGNTKAKIYLNNVLVEERVF